MYRLAGLLLLLMYGLTGLLLLLMKPKVEVNQSTMQGLQEAFLPQCCVQPPDIIYFQAYEYSCSGYTLSGQLVYGGLRDPITKT